MKRIFLGLIILTFLGSGVGYAGSYTDSAHGNSTYGVDRTATTQYAIGNCAHCHEQHASIGGAEPAPTGGPDEYLLFDTIYTDQDTGFCFDCHNNATTTSATAIVNRSYSYNFGGDTTAGSYYDDILEAFSYSDGVSTSGSSHHLPNIAALRGTTLQDADGNEWTLPADISPCNACHNSHIVQRKGNAATYDATKSAISRPSDPDNKWGDDVSERMGGASGAYSDFQAPYWYGPTTTYEPAEDATTNGSNMPNYVRLCTDCHNDYNTIASTNPRLPGQPRDIDQLCWKTTTANSLIDPDAHGLLLGNGNNPRPPYLQDTNYTLSCTCCHEAHGSPNNIYLVRSSINGVDISVPDETDASWTDFCTTACHTAPSHGTGGKYGADPCATCHHHGETTGGF